MGRVHSVDDYLEAIYFLATPGRRVRPGRQGGAGPRGARGRDAAASRPPTASEMLKRLEAEGLVERGPRKGPLLTKKGRDRGRAGGAPPPHHRALPDRLHGLHGRPSRTSTPTSIGDAFSDEMVERLARAARPPRPLPARLAGGHRARAGGEPRPARSLARSSRGHGAHRPPGRARRRPAPLVLRAGPGARAPSSRCCASTRPPGS